MERLLENKVALVTGGSSGIGRASALAFAREGAKVTIADINVEGGMETVEMIRRAGGESIFVRTDVSRGIEVEAMVDKTVETYGCLDCAHNNAGIGPSRSLLADCTEEEWDRVVGINLKGVWLCMKYEIPHMLRQGKGAIVNTASAAGLVAYNVRFGEYIAAKHGVVGLTKAATADYASAGIRVNAVCPGTILTPLVTDVFDVQPELKARALAAHPIGHLGTPEEVAEAVVWLCSDAASFVTGEALPVDGGYVAR